MSVESLLDWILPDKNHSLTVFANRAVNTDKVTVKISPDEGGNLVGHGRVRGLTVNISGHELG